MKKIVMTPMLKRYLLKFALRITIFIIALGFYIHDKQLMTRLFIETKWYGINFVRILWFIFMTLMLVHIFPNNRLSMALRKSREQEYTPVPEYQELRLLQYVQRMNVGAWIVLLVWISFNAIFGILYLAGILEVSDLLMLTVFFFLCDYICILLFCPFQTGIMKNKCCVNCRIYDWGHFMMFTPMVFIRNFFSWSLFFTSIVVLVHWELVYAKHPERFWEGSNKQLQCAHCQDKTCQLKKLLAGKL